MQKKLEKKSGLLITGTSEFLKRVCTTLKILIHIFDPCLSEPSKVMRLEPSKETAKRGLRTIIIGEGEE